VTLFYYIAARHELPTGSFGQKKTVVTIIDYVSHVNPAAKDQVPMQILLEKYPQGDKLIDVYETEEDAAGLYISGPISRQSSYPITHPFVYQVNPEGGSFKINDEIKRSHPISYQINKKCLNELFDYMRRNIKTDESLELYSCWANGQERFSDAPKKELNLIIELSTFRMENEFEWKERQYITVKK
jgi:hypothetical protein